MRPIRFWLCLLLLGCALSASAVPAVLIVRIKPKNVPLLDTPICDLVANEVQASGRMVPIVWSLTDPVFRSAVDSGKIKSGIEAPTVAQAIDAARKLKAEYVLATDMRAGDAAVLGAAFLYKNGSLVWKDPDVDLSGTLAHLKQMLKKKQITQEGYDKAVIDATYRSCNTQIGNTAAMDDTMRSLARTWVEIINSGPLLGLKPEPAKVTPDPGKGQKPPTLDPAAPLQIVKPDNQWVADVDAAIKAGDGNRAVILLRDAVDAAPMDLKRRIALIQTLINTGKPDVAAQEARRAAELMPDKSEIRCLAARAWLQVGNLDEAQADLNEAVARFPEAGETRMLLAHVAISKGDFPGAISHLDKVLAGAPSGDAYYMRSLARAMSGETEAASADVKKAVESGLSQDPRDAELRYGLVAAVLDDAIASIGDDIRVVQQRAQVKRSDKDVQTSVQDLSKRVTGRLQFVLDLPVPTGHETSHNRRVLAYRLLAQCLTDLDSFLKSGDVDVLTDSRINLGEALKQGVSARQGFKEEQQGTKKSSGKPG